MATDKNFTIIDYLVFVVLLLASSMIGVYFWYKDRKIQNNKNYLVGGRDLAIIPVSLSLAASFMSTNTILGAPAEIYMLGSQIYVNMFAFLIAVLLATYVFMPVYYDLELVSINKYLLRRFDSNSVRLAGSIGFIFATVPYMGCVLYGPSLALNSVTPLSMTYSILSVGVICTFYTTIGGIKAVIWTDVIQCGLMFLGLLMVIGCGIYEFGFLKPFEVLAADNRLIFFNGAMDIHRSDVFFSIFFGTLAGWVGVYCVKQTQIQRYCCLSSKAKARKSLWIHLPITVAIAYFALWCGVIIYTKYRGCDPLLTKEIDRYDQLMPYYVMDTMGHIPGLPGLFVVCVFSGALSTLSSGFNALTTVTYDDFIKRYFRNSSERTTGIVTKSISLFYGLLSIGIAFIIGRLGTVMQASHMLAGCISGPLLALFILGFFFPFVDHVAGLSSIIVGFMVCLWIAVGSVINVRPTIQLPVFADKCAAGIYENYDNKLRYLNLTGDHKDLFKITANNFTIPGSYHPNGLNYLYHMSYWLVPAFGFAITITLGILIGLIRVYLNKKSFSLPEKNYVSPVVRKFFYKKEQNSANLKQFGMDIKSYSNHDVDKLDI